MNSLHENGCFSVLSVFRGVPPIWGLLLASCWRLAGLLLASCWRLAGVLLASCWPLVGLLLASSWPLAGLLLATSFPRKISLQNGFFTRLAKLVNSLHENGCFSWFRGVSWGPPHLGLFLASCWPLPGVLLASCWRLAGLLLASAGLLLAACWPLAGFFLASCWLLAGFKLPHEDFSRKSVFGKLAKTVNSLHENGCFSWFRGVSWGPPHLGLLPGFLLASCSCWLAAGFLLASCWPLAGFFLASCWLLAGFKLPHEDFSRKSVFGKARENDEFSS